MQIAKHRVVSIEYTLTDDEGTVLDTSRGREPLVYLHGVGQMIAGLEAALTDKGAGDALEVRVLPAEAYGERDDSLVQKASRSQLRGVADVEVGMQFQANGPQGRQIVTVVAVDGDQVTLDANHPLAGVPLNFAVEVVAVRAATAQELQHGHIHGPHGHDH
jgi:FKBP-type peptidyl-prolyl cis-trans isomerase SlyD